MVLVQPCARSQAFGLCLLNLATFPSELPRWRQLPGDWLSLQRRLRINHVLVATSEEESGHILGSVEVHSPQYQQRLAGGAYSPEQLARLQPYLASLAVREGARGRGVGQSLVEAAVEAVRSSDYAGEHLLLGVTETNSAAVRLYERCGFETLSIYGGRVLRDAAGTAVIGKQFEEHNSLPGPVYAGGGYTLLSAAIRGGPPAVRRVLQAQPGAAREVTTGGATALHVCGMSRAGEMSTALLLEALGADADVEATDAWGYTPLQRHASNNLAVGAQAGGRPMRSRASHTRPSGLEGRGDSARALARRFRHFATLRVFQQFELERGIPLPEGEIEL
ncbi:hypothetical protein EMIHUDRAFT_250051 [Emiliania huxleyi CCMP1516]|uniref:N-acetyltransferase domain-containing protein n=2 Tax=Emiliania huxleyi TaxID=2903 RepID=A0A0D3I459_EMIH1|nr:hypothetical protein EMIHUDRAFT_250051 [Emiliania huxleyi CCMP1516]EOD06044.1 hypothetical protein EMIHUDRAFT_250051 [Emiliania huxleyi CCMP1516]|eukprot:XP_005758473.1 hypothetical protein EMIHUDRAFT_250051 [Emiliania huxleyi CCMP1516]